VTHGALDAVKVLVRTLKIRRPECMLNVCVSGERTFFVIPKHRGRNHETLSIGPSKTRHPPRSDDVGNLALNAQGGTQELACQRQGIGGGGAVNEHTFDAQRLLDATSGADDRVFTNVKAVVCSPDVAKVVPSAVTRDSVSGKERVENLGGKVGKEARLTG